MAEGICTPRGSVRYGQVERLVAVPGRRRVLSGGLAATKQSHGEVLDVGGPLGCQLEELDVAPFDAIYGHWGMCGSG